MPGAAPLEGEPRPPLSRERVVRGAVDHADTHGLDALTMRGLGRALGVEGMALYKHVANKDDLLAGMIDLVLDELDLPSPGEEWKEELRRSSLSAYRALLRHPWSCQLLVSGVDGSGPPRWRQMDAILGTLRAGGFSAEMTHHAFDVLDIYVKGSALGAVSFPLKEADIGPVAERFLQEFPAADHPYVVEHIHYHLETGVLGEGDFEFGLTLLLDSLERLRGVPGESSQYPL